MLGEAGSDWGNKSGARKSPPGRQGQQQRLAARKPRLGGEGAGERGRGAPGRPTLYIQSPPLPSFFHLFIGTNRYGPRRGQTCPCAGTVEDACSPFQDLSQAVAEGFQVFPAQGLEKLVQFAAIKWERLNVYNRRFVTELLARLEKRTRRLSVSIVTLVVLLLVAGGTSFFVFSRQLNSLKKVRSQTHPFCASATEVLVRILGKSEVHQLKRLDAR